MIEFTARAETWPLSRPFRISRGMKTAAEVVVVEARDCGRVGLGEAVPYARYGENVDSVLEQIRTVIPRGVLAGRAELQAALPAVERFDLTTNLAMEQNVPFYERHGWRLVRIDRLDGGIALAQMSKLAGAAAPDA